MATLFVSYRRSQGERVEAIVAGLRAAGVDCFFDRDSIDPLEDFPNKLRIGIDRSHALLVWWSSDYNDSSVCQEELRRGWQHARRRSSDVARRIWILNPEVTGHHISAGEIESSNYLSPPASGSEQAWYRDLRARLDALVPEGPLADERVVWPPPTHHGTPSRPATFTGRGGALMRVHSKLHPVKIDAASYRPAVQIAGASGIGKTTLAAAYAEEFAAAYPGGVYWLNFAGYEPAPPVREETALGTWLDALKTALEHHPELQRTLMYDAVTPLSSAAVRERVARHLLGVGPYLWIVDNLPVLSPIGVRQRILDFVRAPTKNGCTLTTTRDARAADGFALETIDALDEASCVRLLSKFRRAEDKAERAAMTQIIAETGAHTQALMLLGEQIRNARGGYARALERLLAQGNLKRIEAVARQLEPELGDKARGIVATFASSLEPLDESSRVLLMLAAVCVPNRPIRERVLAHGFGADEEDDFALAMGSLLRASIATRVDSHARAVTIHPLIADAALQLLDLDPDGARQRMLAALNALSVNLLEQANESTSEEHADEDLSEGSFEEGLSYAEEAVQLALRVHRLDDVDLTVLLQNLAFAISVRMHSPHELEEVVALQELALLISANELGADHQQTRQHRLARARTGVQAPTIVLSYTGIGEGALDLHEFDRTPGLEAPIALRPRFPEPQRQKLWEQIATAIASSPYAGEVERLFGPDAPPRSRDFTAELLDD